MNIDMRVRERERGYVYLFPNNCSLRKLGSSDHLRNKENLYPDLCLEVSLPSKRNLSYLAVTELRIIRDEPSTSSWATMKQCTHRMMGSCQKDTKPI